MPNVKAAITHHVYFVRVYMDTSRPVKPGFVRCTSEEKAREFANEAATFIPPYVHNAHRFEDVRIQAL